jgi:hypothetical protein
MIILRSTQLKVSIHWATISENYVSLNIFFVLSNFPIFLVNVIKDV